MIIKNVSREDITKALSIVNQKYDDNIIFRRLDQLNNKGNRFNVTLRVKNSRKAGARKEFTGRHTSPAKSTSIADHYDFFELM